MYNAMEREVRERIPNPLGLDGIEFIEYATSSPQAVGHALERVGFRPVARHRSREVMLYRQGDMNVVVNAHGEHTPGGIELREAPVIAAVAFRVRDAALAHQRALERGGWAVPTHVEVMELNIPAIHGVGGTRIYFVDRYRDFSIWDVDFLPIPGADRRPPAVAGLHWFGLVQYIGYDRMNDWLEFYQELFGFDELPDDERFGVLPQGKILASPCRSFYLQLVEPPPFVEDFEASEMLQRVGLGTHDVPAAIAAWRREGVEFVEGGAVASSERGALTRPVGGLTFELVHDERAPA